MPRHAPTTAAASLRSGEQLRGCDGSLWKVKTVRPVDRASYKTWVRVAEGRASSSTYTIKEYTKKQARKMGVIVRPSKHPGKKIDVFKDGVKVASVGALGYGDYPTFLQTKGRAFAQARRKAYKARHQHTRLKRGSNSYYADNLLW